jgi:hypothetical protein
MGEDALNQEEEQSSLPVLCLEGVNLSLASGEKKKGVV